VNTHTIRQSSWQIPSLSSILSLIARKEVLYLMELLLCDKMSIPASKMPFGSRASTDMLNNEGGIKEVSFYSQRQKMKHQRKVQQLTQFLRHPYVPSPQLSCFERCGS
jgi:hypothetical protein